MKYILSLDQGTTGTRAILYDEALNDITGTYLEHQQFYPHPGWCDHDPEEIYQNVRLVIQKTLDKAHELGIPKEAICCMGIANQGETALAWSRSTGKPYSKAIVWHCQRTNSLAEDLKRDSNFAGSVRVKTGLFISSYFSALKFRWLLDHIPQVQEAALNGDLCFGTLDAWILWKLTDGQVFATDYATASRTMLFNLHTFDWDDEILEHLGIQRNALPELRPNSGPFGKTFLFGMPLPITGSIVDQQGALFGQQCFEEGQLKITYGTGCFLLLNTGEHPCFEGKGLLTTVAWQVGTQRRFALDGGIYIAGAALQWLKTELAFFKSYSEIDRLAMTTDSNGDIYFVPAFAGLSAPYHDPTARGLIIGLTTGTQRAHIVRAAVEGICYQIREIIDMIEPIPSSHLVIRLDGGITNCHFLRQFQADILQRRVHIMENCEATARGVAMLAGLGAGIWKDIDTLKELSYPSKTYQPRMSKECSDLQMLRWKEAVQRCRHWIKQ